MLLKLERLADPHHVTDPAGWQSVVAHLRAGGRCSRGTTGERAFTAQSEPPAPSPLRRTDGGGGERRATLGKFRKKPGSVDAYRDLSSSLAFDEAVTARSSK
ncbi:MAG: hypothetical protein ABTD50_17470 [Polyangiaceae bacterium]|jgi:hypothetical protein